MLDDLRLIFDGAARARLSVAEAHRRAAEQEFEAAAANYLAATTLDPENRAAAFCRQALVTRFLGRYGVMETAPPDPESALALGLAIALDGVAGHADALRRLAVTHDDHAALIWLCDRAGPGGVSGGLQGHARRQPRVHGAYGGAR